MKIKYVNVNGRNVCYGERGQKQKGKSSMILLHGFSADKSMWAPLVRVSTLIHTFTPFSTPSSLCTFNENINNRNDYMLYNLKKYSILRIFSPQNLPRNIHAIALDLPGNGESEPPEEGTDLSFKGLVHSVHQVSFMLVLLSSDSILCFFNIIHLLTRYMKFGVYTI